MPTEHIYIVLIDSDDTYEEPEAFGTFDNHDEAILFRDKMRREQDPRLTVTVLPVKPVEIGMFP